MGHVTLCWQEMAVCPAAGAETCTLTFRDIITLPIRSLLSLFRPDELVRVSTWDGEPGQAGPHLGRTQTSVTLRYSCWILMHHMLPNYSMGTLPPAESRPAPSVCIHHKCFIICCLSLRKLCCRGKKPSSASLQTTDVVVSSACSSAPLLAEYRALAHLLYISWIFPSIASEWIGSFFFIL